jgi:GTP-binding protein EngB required for normal cell division
MQETETATRSEAADNQRNGHPTLLASSDIVPLVAELAARYDMRAIQPLLRVCESAAARADLNVAVLGRFKAGKSSFINHFVGRQLLPVGVIPVTSVITKLHGAEYERADVLFLDGHTEHLDLTKAREFIAESENPGNVKAVCSVRIAVPELAAYIGLCFTDTPGLESAQSRNTEVSLAWAPNVDLALVAIGVDPPLSQQDVTLIRKLLEYTPRICVLLTKADILTEQEREEVLQFVHTQLNRNFEGRIDVFLYSIRPSFEHLKLHLKRHLIDPALRAIRKEKEEIFNHKLRTLLRECGDHLQLTLRSAEMLDAEKQQLRARVLGEKNGFSDTKLELQLIARHNIGAARQHIEDTLLPFEKPLQQEIRAALETEYPQWRFSFSRLLERFDSWLRNAITTRLRGLSSSSQKAECLKPLRDVQRQYVRVLQAFRDRLSAQILELSGVPLRTTETEFEPEPPKAPDIKIGRIFDHNWELISPVIPMAIFRGALKTRFGDRIDYETTKNLSRVTTQWADIVAAAVAVMQREAEGRLNDLIKTIEHLTASAAGRAPEIRLDLERVRRVEAALKPRATRISQNEEHS